MTATLRDVSTESGATPVTEPEAKPQNETNESFQRFELIDRINNLLMVSTKDTLFPNIEDFMREIFSSPYGFFAYVDAHGDLICPSFPSDFWEQDDPATDAKQRGRLPKDQWSGPWGDVMAARKGAIHNTSQKIMEGQRPVARFVATAVVLQKDLLGSLVVAGRDRDYTPEDLHALDMVAAYIAPVLSGILQEDHRRAAEAALNESEEAIAAILDTAVDAIIPVTAEGTIRMVNAATVRMFGYAEKDMLGSTLDQLLPQLKPEDREQYFEHVRQSGGGKSTDERIETIGRRKDGILFPVEMSVGVAKIRDEELYIGVIRDITTREQAERAREASDARYRMLVENMNEGLLHQDADGKIVYINPKLCDMLGYSDEELVGTGLADLVADGYRDTFKKNAITGSDSAVPSYEMGFKRKDGQTVVALIAPQAIDGPDGKFAGAFTVVTDITAHKEAEEARRKGEEKYRMLVEKMNEGFIQLDVSGIIRYVNPRLLEMLGHEETEIVGRSVADFVEKHEHESLNKHLEALRAGKDERYELTFKTKDGPGLLALMSHQGIFDDAGNYQGTFAVVMDITERKKLERKLQEENMFSQLFQAITNATGDAITIEQAVQTCVEEICKFTGWPVGHAILPSHEHSPVLLPSLIWYMTDAKKFEAFRDATKEMRFAPGVGLPGRVLETGQPVWIPDVTKDDGFQRRQAAAQAGLKAAFAFPIVVDEEIAAVVEFFSEDVQELNQAVLDTMGHVSFRLGRAIERRGAEVRIEESISRFRNLTEGSIQGMLVHKEGALLFANQALADILGYASADEILALKRIDQLFAADEIDRVKELSAANELDQDKSVRYEVRYRRKNGQTIWIENLMRPVDWDGQSAHQVALVDIDERKKAEMELESHADELARSNQELDDFAYIASHDLKAPLRGIHNYANFLLEDYGDKLDEEGIDKLNTLTRLSKRMEDIINDLLTYSRVGRTELELKDIDLNTVVADVGEQIDVFLKEREVELRVPRPLPTAKVDLTRVRAVFHNLITNGAKYTDADKKWVEVGFTPGPAPGDPSADGVYYVRDNGIGIREKHLDKIFGIFKRLHAGDKYGGGTGAGLSIVKKIVDQHQGRIWVKSEYGKGTTFFFTLEPDAR